MDLLEIEEKHEMSREEAAKLLHRIAEDIDNNLDADRLMQAIDIWPEDGNAACVHVRCCEDLGLKFPRVLFRPGPVIRQYFEKETARDLVINLHVGPWGSKRREDNQTRPTLEFISLTNREWFSLQRQPTGHIVRLARVRLSRP